MYKQRPPNHWQRYRAALAAYAAAPLNFDPRELAHATAATGWRHDFHAIDLPAEPPGPALAAGSFAAACQVLRAYAFPPPRLLVGYFDPALPLARRVMLLRAQFLGFVFHFGVRVGGLVAEAARPAGPGGAPEQVWGYGYRTLAGHFERGQIRFTVHKNLTTGAVQFQLAAVSQPGVIRNPFYWLGFKVFGRTLQRRFARQSLRRMRGLVAQAVAPPQTMPAAVG